MSIIGWADNIRKNFEEGEKQQIIDEKKRKLASEKQKQKNYEKIENKYSYFYHFTDESNLPSIRKYGLYSWEYLENKMGYKPFIDYKPAIDSKNISRTQDKKNNLSNYIRLSSNKDHDMYLYSDFRELDLFFLQIDKKVILDLNCRFTNENAAKNNVRTSDDILFLLNSNDKHAEILILEHIPKEYIVGKER